MSDLNQFIDTTQKFTAPAPMDTLPTIDRSQQVNYGVEMARRASQQPQPPPVTPMPAIVPVAN